MAIRGPHFIQVITRVYIFNFVIPLIISLGYSFEKRNLVLCMCLLRSRKVKSINTFDFLFSDTCK